LVVACTPYQNPPVETAVPLLKFEAARLHEVVVAPPGSVNAFCWFPWPMADSALEPPGPPAAAETALPRLVLEAVRLQSASCSARYTSCGFYLAGL
jgi:hypothetical protein